MKIVFSNENKIFRLNVVNSEGVEIINPDDVQSIRVILKYKVNNQVWLDYRYPQEENHPEIYFDEEKHKYTFQLTTEQVKDSNEGQVEMVINYRVNDTQFNEGFKSFTRKGIVLKIEKV